MPFSRFSPDLSPRPGASAGDRWYVRAALLSALALAFALANGGL